MYLELKRVSERDMPKLMGIYAESNRENVSSFFPDCRDAREGLEKVEAAFADYIRKEFLADSRNTYCVLRKDGVWVSALRLYALQGFFYIEALETAPACRKRGYGAELLRSVLQSLQEKGPFTVRDNVGKKNAASLATHKKCGFHMESADAFDYLSNQTDPTSYGMIYRHESTPENKKTALPG